MDSGLGPIQLLKENKLPYYCYKTKCASYHITKINSKWIKYLNVRAKTLTLSEENIDVVSVHLRDLGSGNDFLAVTPKAPMAKENT